MNSMLSLHHLFKKRSRSLLYVVIIFHSGLCSLGLDLLIRFAVFLPAAEVKVTGCH